MSQFGSAPLVQSQDLFTSSTTSQQTLGNYAETADGRGYRYAVGTATALVAGKVYQALPQDSTNWQNLTVGTLGAAIGSYSVPISTTVLAPANIMAGGQLTVRSTPGQGFSYRIKSQPASTAGSLTITLEDPIQVALTSSSVIDITPSPYQGIVVNPTTITGIPVGVAVQNTPASNFGWVQTHGIANVLVDASAPTVGQPVAPSTTTAGSVMLATGSQPVIGYAMISTTSAKYAPIFLTID